MVAAILTFPPTSTRLGTAVSAKVASTEPFHQRIGQRCDTLALVLYNIA